MSVLAEKRRARDISLKALEYQTGIDRTKLSKIEHGKIRLKLEEANLLAPILGCEPLDLFSDLHEKDEHHASLS